MKALEGYNGTIFAYGQTSSGKTFSMIGDEEMPGIIPLAIKDIFKQINVDEGRKYRLKIGYIEIYNDKIYDLFDGHRTSLNMYEAKGNVFVAQKEFAVETEEEVLKHFEKGNKLKKIVETSTNERSSRSHSIFRIKVESHTVDGQDEMKVASLFLVDLAGSEKPDLNKSTFSEGLHINKSLLVLGKIIRELAKKKTETKQLNYRECKLTRILSPALGGNSLASIICTVSPTVMDETYHTICFAQNAKKARTYPTFNTAPRVSIFSGPETVGNPLTNAVNRRRKVSTPVNSELDLTRPQKKVRKIEAKSVYRASIVASQKMTVQFESDRKKVVIQRKGEIRSSVKCIHNETFQVEDTDAEMEESQTEMEESQEDTKDEKIKNLEQHLDAAREQIFKSRKAFDSQLQIKMDVITQMESEYESQIKAANDKISSLQQDLLIFEKSVFGKEISLKAMESKMNAARKEVYKIDKKNEAKVNELNERFESILVKNEGTIAALHDQLIKAKIQEKERKNDDLKYYIEMDKHHTKQLEEKSMLLKQLEANFEDKLKISDDIFNKVLKEREDEIRKLKEEIKKNSQHNSLKALPNNLVGFCEQLQLLNVTLGSSLKESTGLKIDFIKDRLILAEIFKEAKKVASNIESFLAREETSSDLTFTPPPSSESGVEHSPIAAQGGNCPYCPKTFARKANVDRHIRNKHLAQELRYECGNCEDTFKTKSALSSHKRTFHRRAK